MEKTKKRKRSKLLTEEKPTATAVPAVRHSEEPVAKKEVARNHKEIIKWINKQRILVFASRGINHRDRHLMEDLKKLMPHHKPEAKMERSKTLSVINEMCEMKNCNKAMMFEGRRKKDLYMWLSNVPNGPSELFTQIFGVPKHHPKSQPFFDHVYTFTILDNRIWFRNYQILSEDGALAEVGPRFVLNPFQVKIFSGSFGGVSLWENPNYVSPSKYRLQIRLGAKNKYLDRVQQKIRHEATRVKEPYKLTPLEDIFKVDPNNSFDTIKGAAK
ncbi:hypothetical protein NQ317_002243 [Molorchus minor]|uniref:Ribosome biogenesis protein BRX1 homolog n=1 Tax=Molorchus minor TaxID=1323400 RepID=A0ABQ9JF34_9CUCU|nr:hypothetical protein NQ317_002243 [Molorchus minor]